MATSITLVDPPLHPRRHRRVLATAMLLVAMLFLPLTTVAQNQTITTLTVQPPNPTAGQVVTLTASVTVVSNLVTVGTVTFLSGTRVLGTVQVVGIDMSGFTPGTATLKLGFPPGTFSLTAQYNANTQFLGSQSGPQPLTVTGTEATMTTLTAVANGSNWNFTASVFGYGLAVPDPTTGTVSLTEVSTGLNLGNIALAGPGGFAYSPLPPNTATVGNSPLGVATGDFNGDGFADLAVANDGDGTVSILLGDGHGNFQAQPPVSVCTSGADSVAVGDFNEDGIPDLVVGCGPAVVVVFGQGNGTFGTPMSYSGFSGITGVAVGDFNGDGNPDIAVSDGDGFASVLLNDGTGNFMPQPPFPAGSGPEGITVGDFNGDGNLDVAVPDGAGNTVTVLLGQGNGMFASPATYPAGPQPNSVVTADFNGDGCPDLAVTNSSGNTVGVLLGIKASGACPGTFSQQQTYPVGLFPVGIATADFNGDGCPDLAVANNQDPSNGTVGVLLGNVTNGSCDGTFQAQLTTAAGVAPWALAIGDFNGDGVPDLAATNFNSTSGNTATTVLSGTATSGTLTSVLVPELGQQQINANYTPNTNFYSNSVGSVLVQGSLIPTTSTLAVTANGQPIMSGAQVPPGTAIVLTTTVVPVTYGTLQASGTVSFFDGTTLLAMVPITIVTMQGSSEGVASFSPNLASGQHSLSAAYSGDNNFGPSGTGVFQLTITAAGKQTPTLNLTVSPNPVNFGSNTYFTATLQSIGGLTPTGTVTFSEGTTVLATSDVDMNGQAYYTNNTLVLGQHTITATYNGDNNFNPASGTVMLQVNTAFILTGNMNSGTVTPPQPATFTVAVDAAWQSVPLIYAVMTCSAPAGLTCSVACPPSPANPPGLGNLCVVTGLNQPTSSMATVTVDTSGLARLHQSPRRGEQRALAALVGFSGFGLVGLVFVPVKLRRKATATFLFLMMVGLGCGIGCTAFSPGSSSSPVNNSFNIKVTATLLEENPLASTGYNNLGLQVFWYELLIK